MADAKSSDPKPADLKGGDTKSGPVKPPVLDLTAREAGKAEAEAPKPTPATPPTGAKDAASKPAPAKPPAPAEATGGFGVGAALVGGVLGLAAAYGLAYLGYWPSASAPAVQADPRLAQFGSAIPELQTVTQTTQSELAALNQRVAGLEKAGGAPVASAPSGELGTIQADIAALTARVDGLGAAPDNAVAPADIAALKTAIAGVDAQLAELGARIGTNEAAVRTMESSVSATSAALAQQPADVGAVLQLPLILSGFESAFATGRPYETELAALRAAMPDVVVPTEIANGAAKGLVRPDLIAAQFAAVLPAVLAGRPANPDAGWQDGALDWLRSVVALRPTGQMEGDDPEAIVSRLEAAIARRDYSAAELLLSGLPEPMQNAAGDVVAMVRDQAAAAQFLETLRTQALSGTGSAS
jgi:hypothetical protein